ncbi:uncharacterized protein PGTG_10774 [Puccinia graminis f. sp. tritici CRL 75-36-700-3]|uniref:Uncharacterized protein n=1 Tax=Puccinia graminis f. sp. tritici (strain CRL 75-36-700-3 / race SCCL) TaxID=418459 RepID=E3KJZ0_PUCGT|nr:uncharacterized protein PGTG_10774 [Puccinia graminis f. sp. tritici CRL 75-36-700-3]EFP84615.2 hypothetical protein PGTG_10774 [Puccinia graminis f. sp. tritici CRL 75-36-700-3]
MHLALSLDCSFLDLTNDDDSAYDSPTSSQEDEPLDAKVLPLPPRQKIKRHRRRRNLYHNELSDTPGRRRQRSGDTENILSLSDINLPLEISDHLLMAGLANWAPSNHAPIAQEPISVSASSSYTSLLENVRDQCTKYLERRSVVSQESTLIRAKPILRNQFIKPRSDRILAQSSIPPLPSILLVPSSEVTRRPTTKRMIGSGINRACSIKLLSSFSIPEKIQTSHPQIENPHDQQERAANFEILISSSGPLKNLDPNQSLISAASKSPTSTTHSLKFKNTLHHQQSIFKTDLFSNKNVSWLSNLSLGKENQIDGLHQPEDE